MKMKTVNKLLLGAILLMWMGLAFMLLFGNAAPQAQEIERPEPWRAHEFAQWRQSIYNSRSGNVRYLTVLKHHRSGACWIYIIEEGIAPAPKEVCQ